MDQKDILVYCKLPKLEIDLRQTRAHDFELHEMYRDEGLTEAEIANIIRSAKAQTESLAHLRRLLPHALYMQWAPWETEDNFEEWAALEHYARTKHLVIALGGDNNFQYASHYRDDLLILGLNSDPDPMGSHGHLLWGTVAQFEPMVPRLLADDFAVQNWPRLDLDLDGTFVGRASNQISLGANDPMLMSRHVLTTPQGEDVQQKGSGLIVANGAGSSGWFRSEAGSMDYDFPREAQELRWLMRAPQRYDDNTTCAHCHGVIRPGEKLVVRSLNPPCGGYAGIDDRKLSRDSPEPDLNFDRGVTATIRMSEHPLRVVML